MQKRLHAEVQLGDGNCALAYEEVFVDEPVNLLPAYTTLTHHAVKFGLATPIEMPFRIEVA